MKHQHAVDWLLDSGDPSVRYLTLTDVLDESETNSRAKRAREKIPEGPKVKTLLSGQQSDGGFGVHPYQKWKGAHWRLVSLVEMAFPRRTAAIEAAINQVLKWLIGYSHRSKIRAVNGRVRRCASQEGNALAVCSKFGLTEDDRVEYLASSLAEWQWPDGGWNCDKKPEANHSSFYESLIPLWGLTEHYKATEDPTSKKTAEKTAEFFLKHRMFRSETTDEVINSEWLKLHYPLYWHYDILHGLLILSRLRELKDQRLEEALDIIEEKQLQNGLWKPEGYYWWPPGKRTSNVEVVHWARGEPSEMITLNALRVLKSAGRLD